ncbi:hypothetical protein DENSPDRAFT_702044 [Dentipellis sp. KUC8613]|nr:hypothetical protein DENSPDRAFT_702044 [Dentipellis sp. KUC8613]
MQKMCGLSFSKRLNRPVAFALTCSPPRNSEGTPTITLHRSAQCMKGLTTATSPQPHHRRLPTTVIKRIFSNCCSLRTLAQSLRHGVSACSSKHDLFGFLIPAGRYANVYRTYKLSIVRMGLLTQMKDDCLFWRTILFKAPARTAQPTRMRIRATYGYVQQPTTRRKFPMLANLQTW